MDKATIAIKQQFQSCLDVSRCHFKHVSHCPLHVSCRCSDSERLGTTSHGLMESLVSLTYLFRNPFRHTAFSRRTSERVEQVSELSFNCTPSLYRAIIAVSPRAKGLRTRRMVSRIDTVDHLAYPNLLESQLLRQCLATRMSVFGLSRSNHGGLEGWTLLAT